MSKLLNGSVSAVEPAFPTTQLLQGTLDHNAPTPPSTGVTVLLYMTVKIGHVRRQCKAAGPDGISLGVLCPVLSSCLVSREHIFKLNLLQNRIPVRWKNVYSTSTIESHPIWPQRLHTCCLNVTCYGGTGETGSDPPWTTNETCFSLPVNNAVIYLLQRAHSHLEVSGGTVRTMFFFYFSHPFNTIQPRLLSEKLLRVDDSSSTVWNADYLSDRAQFECSLSDVVVSNTGAPHVTAISPFLFTLCTSDFQYNSKLCLQKFSDDSVVVRCIRDGQESEYRQLVDDFVKLCSSNHLLLNVNNTKEMVVHYRRTRTTIKLIHGLGGQIC